MSKRPLSFRTSHLTGDRTTLRQELSYRFNSHSNENIIRAIPQMWEALANNPVDWEWYDYYERPYREYQDNWNAQEVMEWFSNLDLDNMMMIIGILEDYVAEDEKLMD